MIGRRTKNAARCLFTAALAPLCLFFAVFCRAEDVPTLYGGENIAFSLRAEVSAGRSVTVDVTAPETAEYMLLVEYSSEDAAAMDVKLELMIDGKLPASGASSLYLSSEWLQPESIRKDRYGNEISPLSIRNQEILSVPLQDSVNRGVTPVTVFLTEGYHEVRLKGNEGRARIWSVVLAAPETPAKDVCLAATGEHLIFLEAEQPRTRSDAATNASSEFSASLSPHDPVTRKINILTGFDTAGQTIGYALDVPADGWYQVTIHARQTSKVGMPVKVCLRIDGELPSIGAISLNVPYTRTFERTALGNGGDPYTFFLTEGRHEMTLTINAEHLAAVKEEAKTIVSEINDLLLDVTRLTSGSNDDLYRDYNIAVNIPDAAKRIVGWADRLEGGAESLKARIGNGAEQECACMLSAARRLRSLAEEPEELPLRLSELSGASGLISEQLTQFDRHQIDIDWIAVHQESAVLPSEPSWFDHVAFSARRFIASMGEQDYEANAGGTEALQVWMGRSRPYAETLQVLIDSEFTPDTGIHVDVCMMPDANRLVLSTAAGNGPDAVLSMQYVLPSYLDIRGALLDLSTFEDFGSVASRFPAGLFVPYTLDGGIYALPETVNTYVLFYRTDLLDYLHLTVPDTMRDVMNMLPVLRQNGMNFFYPTAGMDGEKWFSGTLPLIWQNGGHIYGETVRQTGLVGEGALAGFTQLTELFTIGAAAIDLPSSSFFQSFRTGTVPIGISDISSYMMLKSAAPEIDGLWEIALFPGVEDESGIVQRQTSGGAETMGIMRSTDRAGDAWTFLKWWSDAGTQAEFARRLQLTYGYTYLWRTANTEAFQTLSISEKDKSVLTEQIGWSTDAPWVPGTYMLERELSNAFLSVVNDGTDARKALDTAIRAIDRETERKLEEFGYIQDGITVRELKTPTVETVLGFVLRAKENE